MQKSSARRFLQNYLVSSCLSLKKSNQGLTFEEGKCPDIFEEHSDSLHLACFALVANDLLIECCFIACEY